MSSRPLLLALLLPALLLAGLAPAQDTLLRRSDVGAFVPASFRARLTIDRGGDASDVEIYRSGTDRTLLRFLAPKERGKFLLRRGADLWLIAPDARKPVRLSPSHRVYGAATIDVLFSLQLADDYEIVSTTQEDSAEGTLTVFELRAIAREARFAEVRYAVDPRTARPASAVYRVRSGRPVTRVAFQEWSAGDRYATVVEVTDLLRKDPPTRITVGAFTEGPVPDALFDLADEAAREALPEPGQDGQRLRKQNH